MPGTRPEPGDEFELRIDSLAAGGMGVGRHAGLVVFVPLCAPGDTLRVRVTHARRRWAQAEIVELVEPGPERTESPCPYYARCGGCDWMHIGAVEQSRARAAIVCEALRRIGGLEVLPPVEHVPSPMAFGYRARARVAYAPGQVGFRARGSHEVVDVERCAVLDAGTQQALTQLRENPPRGSRRAGNPELWQHVTGRVPKLSGLARRFLPAERGALGALVRAGGGSLRDGRARGRALRRRRLLHRGSGGALRAGDRHRARSRRAPGTAKYTSKCNTSRRRRLGSAAARTARTPIGSAESAASGMSPICVRRSARERCGTCRLRVV